MTDTVELRDEVNASLAVVVPQIRGLEDLARTSLIQPSAVAVNDVLLDRRQRKELLDNVILALDALDRAIAALEADGHPELSTVFVEEPILSDLAEERADLASALGVFQLDRAIRLDIQLGDPEPKP